MAVQARHISHDFPAAVGGGSLFLDEYAPTTAPARPRDTTVLRDFPRSDLACNYGGFVPRKRPRLAVVEAPAPGCFLDDQRALMTPVGIEGLVAAPTDSGVVDAQSKVVGSGAASTSGRVANGASATRGLLSWMHRQGAVEIDALVRLEAERMRAGLEEARRRHARALLAAAGRAASGRLRAAEAEASRALRRNAELEEKAWQMCAECQAWVGVASSHEAVAAGLRATLDQLLLQSPRSAEGDAEDARSCCFETPPTQVADADEDGAAPSSRSSEAASCKSCGGGDACVLLLPCRHLCLCRACEPAVDACPVCAAAKNGSLHVLFS